MVLPREWWRQELEEEDPITLEKICDLDVAPFELHGKLFDADALTEYVTRTGDLANPLTQDSSQSSIFFLPGRRRFFFYESAACQLRDPGRNTTQARAALVRRVSRARRAPRCVGRRRRWLARRRRVDARESRTRQRQPTGRDLNSVVCLEWSRRVSRRVTTESVLESHEPCESFELSIVQIGLETTEFQVENETQIDTVVGRRCASWSAPAARASKRCDARLARAAWRSPHSVDRTKKKTPNRRR